MHRTQTVDLRRRVGGRDLARLDDGERVHLKRGDVVIQNGTRHAWGNEGTERATMLFFMVGARSES